MARALKVQNGALIQFVAPNSPAATAGLLPTRRSAWYMAAASTVANPVYSNRTMPQAAGHDAVAVRFAVSAEQSLTCGAPGLL